MYPKPKDVLLAEDDHDDIDLFNTAINETTIPHVVRYAYNGDELFVELEKAIPHLLFLDIRMPCKDGLSCILQIRKSRRYDNLPVIMLTSLSHNPYIENSYRYGANYYVVKPTKIAALTQKLQYLLMYEWEKQMYYPPREEFVLH